ncbi:MAG TPA: hypothetical protein DCQ28_04780 [Bacteroidetes bacterium]|nr:hypothetical protein [Bacteroidota bacterium]
MSFHIWSSSLQATEVNVSSVAALQSAINSASSGDVLILANGTYLNNVLNIGTNNITVKAATSGGVFFNGTNDINLTGNYITFSGFQFTSGSITGIVLEISESHNIVTQCNWNGYIAQKYIRMVPGSQYNEISYCNIENKDTSAVKGCTIQINTSPTVVGYHTIRYCSFKNFPGLGGDYGNEPIRIGLSTEMTNISRTIVEYCYFENVGLGDSESISVKSSENICRFNTFTNNANGMLVFRHGYRNIAYSNFFINGSGGIRIKEGGDHFIYNNYFETGSAAALTLQYVVEYPLNNINFIHNTFVNMGSIDLGGTGPTNVTFANNIFKKSSGSIFTNANGGTTWVGNISNGTLGITISSGMTNTDPLLVANTENYKSISSSSPAINAASSSYPAILDIANVDDDPTILFDISGQSRPATVTQKDIGCDEYTTGSTTNHPLVLSEVGPFYLGGPNPLPVELQSFTATIHRGNVELVWSTAMEVNNAGFEIERQTMDNEQLAMNNWVNVGFVEGAGTSYSPKKYSFVDARAKGTVAYRLKQIDRDGKYNYSKTIEVAMGITVQDFKLTQNYPNPFNPTTTIHFQIPTTGPVSLKIYDQLGRETATLAEGIRSAGQHHVEWNASGFPSGIYFYRLQTEHESESRKIVFIK